MDKKDGFVAIEVILFSSFIIALLVCLIGIFAYIYPVFRLQYDMNILTRQAQKNGGLTSENIMNFEDRIGEYSFVSESGKPVIIEGETIPSKRNIIGINNNNYIDRDSGEIMGIVVKIPSDNRILSRFTEKNIDYYVLKSFVLSERL